MHASWHLLQHALISGYLAFSPVCFDLWDIDLLVLPFLLLKIIHAFLLYSDKFQIFFSALCPVSSSTSLQFKLRHGLLWEVFPNALPSPTAGCVPQQGIQGVLHSVTVHLLVFLVD